MKIHLYIFILFMSIMHSSHASQSYGPHKQLASELYAVTIKNNSKKELLYTINNQDLAPLSKDPDLPMFKKGTRLTIYEMSTGQAAHNLDEIYSQPITTNRMIIINDNPNMKKRFEITEIH